MLGIVLVLITMTIIFETLKDYIQENASSNMKLIVDKLFGEMTVLGFLTMFTFAFSRTGLFATLSMLIFGNNSTLTAIFEEVHFTIFFIMVFFVIQVLILMYGAMKTEEEWLDMETQVRNPTTGHDMQERAQAYYENEDTQEKNANVCYEMMSLIPGMRRNNLELHENEILYKSLRDEFILERAVEPPFKPSPEQSRVENDFNFGRYQGICLGQMLGQVVNLHTTLWYSFMLASVIYYGFVLLVGGRVEVTYLLWTLQKSLRFILTHSFLRIADSCLVLECHGMGPICVQSLL